VPPIQGFDCFVRFIPGALRRAISCRPVGAVDILSKLPRRHVASLAKRLAWIAGDATLPLRYE